MTERQKILEEVVEILVETELEFGLGSVGFQAISEALGKLAIAFHEEVPDLIERFTAGRLGRP